jgi:serine/threonine protein kinase
MAFMLITNPPVCRSVMLAPPVFTDGEITNSPEHISNDTKSLIRWMVARDPTSRPSARALFEIGVRRTLKGRLP